MKHIAVLILALAALCAPASAKSTQSPPLAHRFELPGRTGTVALDSLRGKAVWLDFWASWCGPCRQSFPWMDSLAIRYGDRGLAIVAIDLDKDRDLAQQFLDEVPASFIVAFDPGGKTAEAYHVKAMPTSFLISADGHVLESHAGFDPKRAAAIEASIVRALPLTEAAR